MNYRIVQHRGNGAVRVQMLVDVLQSIDWEWVRDGDWVPLHFDHIVSAVRWVQERKREEDLGEDWGVVG